MLIHTAKIRKFLEISICLIPNFSYPFLVLGDCLHMNFNALGVEIAGSIPRLDFNFQVF